MVLHLSMSVRMAVVIHFHGYEIDLAVADFAYRHQGVGKCADFACCATENYGFQAIVVIEMHVHG